jgi:SAM-dependent methyltransferase
MADIKYDQYFEEDLNKDTLISDNDFLFDASEFLAKRKGIDATDPEEIYSEFISHMRQTDVNELDTINDLMYAQEADEEDKEVMRRLYEAYDKMPIEFTEDIGGKIVDYGTGLLTAPSTYLGAVTGGAVKVGTVAAQQAAKMGVKEILRRGALTGATKAALVEGGIGAVQGGLSEGVRVEIDPDREFTGEGILTGAAAGAIPGLVIGGTTGYVATRNAVEAANVQKRALDIAEQTARAAEEAADEVITSKAGSEAVKKVQTILRPIDEALIREGDAARELLPAELTVQRLDESTRKRVTGAVVELIGDVKPKAGERVTEMIARTLRESDDAQKNIQDILTKYDLSGEQLGAVFAADVSEAGRTLGEVGQIKKLVNTAVEIANDTSVRVNRDALESVVNESAFLRGLKDQAGGFERMRRAVLTSQVQTTVRNFVGGGARVAMDVVETFIEDKTARVMNKLGYKYDTQKFLPDSTSIAKYLFNQQEAEMVVDMYRRTNPEAADRVFKTFIDATDLSEKVGTHTAMEAFGLKINFLNKISDNYYKRAIFSGHLQRLVKARYGKNLIDMIQEGSFNKIDPKLLDEAGNKAFELLYQLTPSGKGEGVSGLISTAAKGYLQKVDTMPGLNMVTGALMPFPRFVINQVKFMYDHAPVVGMLTTTAETLPRDISRQLTGMGLIMGGMAIRAQEGTDMEWYHITNERGQRIDLRPLLGPFNMFMYLGDVAYRSMTDQPVPSGGEYFSDVAEMAIGSPMRAGTGKYILDTFGPETFKELTGEADMGLKTQRFAGRVIGDYFATLFYAMPIAVARDLYQLTDEEARIVPQTNGGVTMADIMLLRATRALPDPVREMFAGPKEERYTITSPSPTRKQDPIGTMVTGAGKQAPANVVEKELARLRMDSYDLYKPVPFGPADVQITKQVSELLPNAMMDLFQSNRYKNAKSDAERQLLIKGVATAVITPIRSNVFDSLRAQADAGTIDFDVETVNQFEFEGLPSTLTKAARVRFKEQYGRNLGGDDYQENDYGLAIRLAKQLERSVDPKNYAEGGFVTNDPLMLSETAEEMDPVAREQAGDQYLSQMTELGLDLAPVTGEIRSGQQALKDFEEGNYGMATLGAIGALPIVGAPARAIKKGLGAKKILDDLPPPEAAQRTQIPGTLPTYVKAKEKLDQIIPEGRTLDFGAGLGLGAKEMGADSYEPFAREGFIPTFNKSDAIPSDSYEKITNLNVLNVVPREVRDDIVKEIGRVLKPGGTAVITTRGKDVMKAKGRAGPEDNSIITSAGTYQKGFTKPELEEYVKETLGDGFEIKRLNLGPAGVTVTKK